MYQEFENKASIYNYNDLLAVNILQKNYFINKQSDDDYEDDSFEIWLINKSCNITISGKTYSVIFGDIFVFSENEARTVDFADSDTTILTVRIDPYTFSTMLPKSSPFTPAFFENHSNEFTNLIKSGTNTADKISALISHAFSQAERNDALSLTNIFTDIVLILNEIYLNTSYANKSSLTASHNPKRTRSVKKAVNYINTHITDDLTLEKIATASNLSPNYLSNLFSEYTGTKLWDYITEKRINLSKKLLLDNPTDSIIAIALKCGFNNCPNFNRAFKKYTNTTPMEYKRSFTKRGE